MGEVEKNNLLFWCQKIVNDPDLLAEDPRGHKIGSKEFSLGPSERLTTFCNIAVHRICRGLDYPNLNGMTADDMHSYFVKNWITPFGDFEDKMLAAYNAGSIGDLSVLSWVSHPHGHVTVVAPLKPMLYSGKWASYVPQVANVGKTNGFMGANYAFGERPDVFILGRMVL